MVTLNNTLKELTYEKLFFILCISATLAPSFGAIDNNAIRWFFLAIISVLYLIKLLIKSEFNSILNSRKKFLFLSSFLYLIFCAYNAYNNIEGIISLYKLIIIISVFTSSFFAIKKMNNPFVFLCKVFSLFLFIESIYTVLEFLIADNDFRGVSNNRNISSFSILFKIIFLKYLIFTTKTFKESFIYKVIEVLGIISIIILQSRLGMISLIGSYLVLLIFLKKNRFSFIFSIIILSLSTYAFQNIDNEKRIQKNYNILNLNSDESTNQRLSFYSNAYDLIKQKPIIGFGLGSWKYESLKYRKITEGSLLVPYYVHNDFLQITVETGIIGLIIYLIFLFQIFSSLKIKYWGDPKFYFIIISLGIFLMNSFLNFPIHRSQEYIPFLILSAFILSTNQNTFHSKKKNSLIIYALIILTLTAAFFSYKEHDSLILQGVLLSDYRNGKFSIDKKELDEINYKIPNLTSNAVPVSSYLSRYFFELGDYKNSEKLLKNSLKANKNDLITKELLLKNNIFLNKNQEAFKIAKELIFFNPENINYAQLYFSLVKDLSLTDEILISPVIYKSNNLFIHRLYHQTASILIIKNDEYFQHLNYSRIKFPNSSF